VPVLKFVILFPAQDLSHYEVYIKLEGCERYTM